LGGYKPNPLTRGSSEVQKKLSGNPIPIVGAWKLVSFQVRTENDQVLYPYGEDAQGSIIYTESGRVSAQLTRANRPRFEATDEIKGVVVDFAGSVNGCISYYGSYEYDEEGGFVVHRLEGSLFQDWEGQALKRHAEVTGNRLKLTAQTAWAGSRESVLMVEWERIG
jgi:hypothetical protein